MTILEFYNMTDEQYKSYIKGKYPYKFKINLDGTLEHMFDIFDNSTYLFSYENLIKHYKGKPDPWGEVFVKQYRNNLVHFEYIQVHQDKILDTLKKEPLRNFAIQTNPELLI